jgi:hypothetical protein
MESINKSDDVSLHRTEYVDAGGSQNLESKAEAKSGDRAAAVIGSQTIILTEEDVRQ